MLRLRQLREKNYMCYYVLDNMDGRIEYFSIFQRRRTRTPRGGQRRLKINILMQVHASVILNRNNAVC